MAPKKFELTEVDREILRSYQYMLDGLALYLGDSYEIVLHSLEELSHSVIKIINGHYTKREAEQQESDACAIRGYENGYKVVCIVDENLLYAILCRIPGDEAVLRGVHLEQNLEHRDDEGE